MDVSVHRQVADVKLWMLYRLADAMESSGFWLASLYLCIWDFSAPSLQSVCTLHRTAASAPLWFGCSHPCHHLWWPADLLPSWISETRSRYRADMWCCELHWPCSSPSVWKHWPGRRSRHTVACLCISVKDKSVNVRALNESFKSHFGDSSREASSVWGCVVFRAVLSKTHWVTQKQKTPNLWLINSNH